MSTTKRFTIVSSDVHAGGFAIKAREDGIYCLHSDYAAIEAERDALRERCDGQARTLKHSQDVFDAIDMTGLCPLCQGDEYHNSGCPMRAVEEEIQAALAATEPEDCPECDGAGQQINMAPGPLCGVMRICPACEGTGVNQGASK